MMPARIAVELAPVMTMKERDGKHAGADADEARQEGEELHEHSATIADVVAGEGHDVDGARIHETLAQGLVE